MPANGCLCSRLEELRIMKTPIVSVALGKYLFEKAQIIFE